MVSASDPGVLAWAALLRTQAAVLAAIEGAMRPTGLPLAWYDVLLELRSAPGARLTMGALGERVVLSRSRVSRVVDDMVRAGLVTREANRGDRRSAFAVMTPAGRRAFRRAAPVYLDAIDAQFARHMSRREQEAVAHALGKVVRAHEAASTREPASNL